MQAGTLHSMITKVFVGGGKWGRLCTSENYCFACATPGGGELHKNRQPLGTVGVTAPARAGIAMPDDKRLSWSNGGRAVAQTQERAPGLQGGQCVTCSASWELMCEYKAPWCQALALGLSPKSVCAVGTMAGRHLWSDAGCVVKTAWTPAYCSTQFSDLLSRCPLLPSGRDVGGKAAGPSQRGSSAKHRVLA